MKPEFKFEKQKSGSSALDVIGDLTIDHSAQFKDQLVKCLSEGGGILISLEEVTAIDVTAIQLLHSLRIEMNAKKKSFSVIAPNVAGALDLLTKSGLIKIFETKQ